MQGVTQGVGIAGRLIMAAILATKKPAMSGLLFE